MPDELSRSDMISAAIAEHAPAEEKPVIAPAPEPNPEPTPGEIQDSESKIYSDRARTPDGKFAKVEEKAAEAPAEPKPLSPRAPNTWRTEAKTKWESVDPDIKAEIIKREIDAANGIREYKTQAQEAQAFREAVGPWADQFKQLGTSPVEIVRGLMPSAGILYFGSPEQKLQALVETARNFGVDLNQLSQYQAPQIDPGIRQLQNQVSGLQQAIHQTTSQQQQAAAEAAQAETQRLHSEIADFAKSHPHFDAVREQMAHLVNGGHATTLEEAYAMAVYANDALRTTALQQAPVQQQAQAAQRAKAAAVSVKGGSPTGSAGPSNPADREAAIRYAIQRHTR